MISRNQNFCVVVGYIKPIQIVMQIFMERMYLKKGSLFMFKAAVKISLQAFIYQVYLKGCVIQIQLRPPEEKARLAQGWHSFKQAYSNAANVIQHIRIKTRVVTSSIQNMSNKSTTQCPHAHTTTSQCTIGIHFFPLHYFLTKTAQLTDSFV